MRDISSFLRPSNLSDEQLPAWIFDALAQVSSWHERLIEPLRGRADHFFERLSFNHGGCSMAELLASPWATPFMHLIDAYCNDRNFDRIDKRLIAVGEGTLFLYFAVRVQDDLVDDPVNTDVVDMYLIDAFLGASARAFACGIGAQGRFWTVRDALMCSFNNTAVMEILERRRGRCVSNSTEFQSNSYEWMGQKFLPMAIPLSALSFLVGEESGVAWLQSFVVQFGTGLQMINDIFNVGEDYLNGRQTPVLDELCKNTKVSDCDSIAHVRALLNSSAALPWAMGIARAHIGNAVRIAMDNGAPCVAAVAKQREDTIDLVPSGLLALCLGGSVRAWAGRRH